MTYRETFAALSVIAHERGDAMMLEVQAWCHGDDGDARDSLEWCVWSSNQDRHFKGRSGDEVLRYYRESDPTEKTDAPTDSRLDEVGSP